MSTIPSCASSSRVVGGAAQCADRCRLGWPCRRKLASTLHMHTIMGVDRPAQEDLARSATHLVLPPADLRSLISCFLTIRPGARYCWLKRRADCPYQFSSIPQSPGARDADRGRVAPRHHARASWRVAARKARKLVARARRCWAIVMILTGWYLWWPRGGASAQHFGRAGSPGRGCLSATFTPALRCFFPPCSCFPRQRAALDRILGRRDPVPDPENTGQESPAGFSIGGASGRKIVPLPVRLIDRADARARA